MADPATVDTLADAVANLGEKSIGYDQVGVPDKSGDRPYGKYQIMGNNIPSWSEEAGLGRMSPDEFIKNPDAQEQIAKHRLGKYYDQHGTALDVASMWHSGVPYNQAVKEKRQDALGTKTEDYATRVSNAADTIVTLPDGSEVNLGVNPSPELREKVKAKIREKFPELGDVPQAAEQPQTAEQPTPVPAEEKPLPGVVGGLEPYRALHEAGIPLDRNATVEDTGAQLNKQFGLAQDHKLGRYLAAGGKPFLDAASDIITLFNTDKPPSQGALNDAVGNFARLAMAMHPVVATPEVIGNMAVELAADAGLNPSIGALLGLAASAYVGAKIPAGEAYPTGLSAEVPKKVDLGPAMPLKGTAASRQAAAEAASAATEAEAKAAAARTAQTAETTAAEQQATQAQQTAEQAKAAVQPSVSAKTEAEAALAPAEVTPRQGGQAVTAGLEQRLQEWKEPTQGIYNAYIGGTPTTPGHATEIVDPAKYKSLSDEISTLEGAGRLTGQAGKTISALGEKINTGQRVTIGDLDNYKQALDEVLPGGPPKGANQSERALYDFKLGIRDIIRSTATGEEKAWLDAADSIWRDVIIGKGKPRALGPLVNLVKKDPETAVERLFGNGTRAAQGEMAEAVMKQLGDHPAAEVMRQAFMKRLINNATDTISGEMDPKALVKAAGDLDQTFKSNVLNNGAETFFKTLQQQQKAVEAADVAAKAAKARIGEGGAKVAEAEQAATQARRAATRAQRVAEKPNMLANMTAKGLEVAAGEIAATAFGHPGLGPIFMTRFLFPPDRLAKYLADSTKANFLARLLKTPANSAVVPVLMQKVKSLAEEKPEKKKAA